jgi:Plasmid replication region DNA-binding N-term
VGFLKMKFDGQAPRERAVEHSVKHNAHLIPFDSIGYLKGQSAKAVNVASRKLKGNVFPLVRDRSRVSPMNRRLTEFQIRTTCRALIASDANLTGRQLRRELKNRFGAVGKTARVFHLWREETSNLERDRAAAALPTDIAELQRRLIVAEAAAAENLKRAELAEFREQAHQEHWALKIDELRRNLEEARAENAAGQGTSRVFPV